MATGARIRSDSPPPNKGYQRGGEYDHQRSQHARRSLNKSIGEDEIEDESISDDGSFCNLISTAGSFILFL